MMVSYGNWRHDVIPCPKTIAISFWYLFAFFRLYPTTVPSVVKYCLTIYCNIKLFFMLFCLASIIISPELCIKMAVFEIHFSTYTRYINEAQLCITLLWVTAKVLPDVSQFPHAHGYCTHTLSQCMGRVCWSFVCKHGLSNISLS